MPLSAHCLTGSLCVTGVQLGGPDGLGNTPTAAGGWEDAGVPRTALALGGFGSFVLSVSCSTQQVRRQCRLWAARQDTRGRPGRCPSSASRASQGWSRNAERETGGPRGSPFPELLGQVATTAVACNARRALPLRSGGRSPNPPPTGLHRGGRARLAPGTRAGSPPPAPSSVRGLWGSSCCHTVSASWVV